MNEVPSLEELRARCLGLSEEEMALALSEEAYLGDDWQPTIAKSLMRCCESCCKRFHKVYKVWQYYGGRDPMLAWQEFCRADVPADLTDDELSSPELQKSAVVIRLLMEEEVLRFENPMLAHQLAAFASKLADRLSPRRGLVAVNAVGGSPEMPLAVVALARLVNSFRYTSQRQGAEGYLHRLENAVSDSRVVAPARAEALNLLGAFYTSEENPRAKRCLATAYKLYLDLDHHLAGTTELLQAVLARTYGDDEPLEILRRAAIKLDPWRSHGSLYCSLDIAVRLAEGGKMNEAMVKWKELPVMPNIVAENMRLGLGGALYFAFGNLNEALRLLNTAIAGFENLGQRSYAAAYLLYCYECEIERQNFERARILLHKADAYLSTEPIGYRRSCEILLNSIRAARRGRQEAPTHLRVPELKP